MIHRFREVSVSKVDNNLANESAQNYDDVNNNNNNINNNP